MGRKESNQTNKTSYLKKKMIVLYKIWSLCKIVHRYFVYLRGSSSIYVLSLKYSASHFWNIWDSLNSRKDEIRQVHNYCYQNSRVCTDAYIMYDN